MRAGQSIERGGEVSYHLVDNSMNTNGDGQEDKPKRYYRKSQERRLELRSCGLDYRYVLSD